MLFLLMCICGISSFAQTNSDKILKFLGIPVDGTEQNMIAKLKQKGFTYDVSKKCLKGKFNGIESYVVITTNNGKVDRIMVADVNLLSETDIRIRYNNLISQMDNNEKYISVGNDEIPESEDISYEMSIHNKRYDAAYDYYPPLPETDKKELDELIKSKGKDSYEVLSYLYQKRQHTGSVWFMISEYYGKYYISMYYDNLLNRPNGEDL